LLAAVSPAVVHADLIVSNGDFETPVVPAPWPNYVEYNAGDNIDGWTVGFGSVDVMGPDRQAASGNQSVDLSGSAAGSIYQDLETEPGQSYLLRFAMAANPEGPPVIKTMEVDWGATVVDTPTSDSTNKTISDMGWTYLEYTVTATAATTRLQFVSLVDTAFGPEIDDVSVTPTSAVPEPAALSLMGLGAAALLRRRARARR
jgi:choice-of-anchor C domain-containing protein